MDTTFTFDLISDIHTERHDYLQSKVPIFSETSDNDILIIAGDAGTLIESSKLIDFLRLCQRRYKLIVYVPGNHEFDGNLEIEETISKLRGLIRELNDNENNLGKIYLLSEDILYLSQNDKNIKIIGTTLWTRPHSLIEPMLRDHKVKKMNSLIREKKFLESRKFLKDNIISKKDEIVIVVTHHAPSFKLINPHNNECDFYYASDCDDIIKMLPRGIFWCFGHTHIPTDTTLYGVNILSNPVGYIRDKLYPDRLCFNL